ncbi:DUF305 domain-containing protein [Geodermatophilus sp. CPCC 206100]|uniref:DUF305 domain-containing protein n=1 Tax=Geodermatophilus sp. CPCC 206100 TaxID=3020054 RepID=UPI003AFF741A
MTAPGGTAPRPAALRTVLLAVIAVGLVLLGGGLAVALGIGRGEPAPGGQSVDAGFSRDMSRHHLQGVEMANLVPDRSSDPEVRQLAFDIAETQQNQVGRMQGWLALWALPPSGGETMAWMAAEGGHPGHATGADTLMPGMATDEELAELRALSGTEFDVQFLRLMIRHHQGGREMAEYAAQHAGEPAVRTLAGTIAETQTAEVTTMQRMLTARGGTPLPAP